MRPVAMILVVVAVIAAGLVAFLAKRWVDAEQARQGGSRVVEVLVAAHDVQAGAVLQAGDLRYDKWPASVVTPRLATTAGGVDPKPGFVGTVARFALAEGEPVTQAAVFKQEGAGLLAAMLGPGMRAASVAITNPSAVSGFITPGDHVDVVLAADINKQDGKAVGPIVRYASETVLHDIRVLAIDQQIARGRDGAAIQGKTATLEVTPKQAEVLVTAGMLGQLSLVLRSTARGGDDAVGEPFTPDTEASKALLSAHGAPAAVEHRSGGGMAVKINRGGAVSSKSY